MPVKPRKAIFAKIEMCEKPFVYKVFTAPRHVTDILRVLGSPRHGTPLFFVFALIGAVAAFRSPSRGYHLIILGCLLAEFAALLTIFHFWPRYADSFAVLLLPWTAGGIVVAWRLASRAFAAHSARVAAAAWALSLLAGALWYTVDGLRRDAADPTLFRDAGAWMARNAPHGSVVMAGRSADPLLRRRRPARAAVYGQFNGIALHRIAAPRLRRHRHALCRQTLSPRLDRRRHSGSACRASVRGTAERRSRRSLSVDRPRLITRRSARNR
jgi:hypothetical protein